jgi:phage FluMu gp28-like protein
MAATTGNLAPTIEYDFEDEVGPITDEQWAIRRRAVKQTLPPGCNDNELPDILLKHQKELLNSVSRFTLTATDKSRRVGATWALGSIAVLTAGAQEAAGGMDVLYLGYNLDMAREFIDTCGMWARAFMPACTEIGEFLFEDKGVGEQPDKFIQAFRIRFASGFEIVALSSAPRSLRGRQGLAVLDEFAFHDDAEQLLKAAMAFTIWGGKVVVISTHNGEDNEFNKLLTDIRKGEYGDDANVVRCTFDDAVENGLYERVCLKRGIEWTAEGEAKWRANIRKIYRHNAAEELDCIPSQGSGVYMTRSEIEACAIPPDRVVTFVAPPGFVLKSEAYRISYVKDWLEQHIKPLLHQLDPYLRHAFGQDFARSGDVSCLVPLEIGRDLVRRAPFVVELRNVPYEQQKQIAIYVIEGLPRFMGAKFDATGNGGYLAEVVMQKYGENLVERVTLSQAWYMAHMPKMRDGIEGKRLLFPANDNLVNDMRMVVLVRGVPMVPQGKTVDGSDGLPRHGDFAVALCLANAASLGDVVVYDGFRPVSSDYHQKDTGGYSADDEPDYSRGSRFKGKGTW